MSLQKVPARTAIVFFFFWLLVLLAGADRPPPIGFAWLVAVVAICAIVVYWRLPTYCEWYRTQRDGRMWFVILDGLAAGLVVATPFALKGSGGPSVAMEAADYVVWFAVMGLMGVVNSLTLYAVASGAARRMGFAESGRE